MDYEHSTMPESGGTGTGEWMEAQGFGPLWWVGCIVGPVVFFVVIAGGMLAKGQSWQGVLWLGFFIAAWGGLGFGAMVAGVIYVSRIEADAELTASTKH